MIRKMSYLVLLALGGWFISCGANSKPVSNSAYEPSTYSSPPSASLLTASKPSRILNLAAPTPTPMPPQCVVLPSMPEGVLTFEDMSIVPPATGIPPSKTQFLGIWEGHWRQKGVHNEGAPAVLVVRDVNSESVKAAYVYGDSLVTEVLPWQFGNDDSLTYSYDSTNTDAVPEHIALSFSWEPGEILHGTMSETSNGSPTTDSPVTIEMSKCQQAYYDDIPYLLR